MRKGNRQQAIGKRKISEARELRRLAKLAAYAEYKRTGRIGPASARMRKPTKKNLFGLSSGAPRSRVESQRRKESHKLLDQGKYGQAKRVSKMSTRKYAKKRGIKVEGRLRAKLRKRKEHARAKAHGLVERIFGARNPVPALLTSLGSAIEEGAGFAVGSAVGSRAIKDADGSGRTTVKKPKKPKSKPRRGKKRPAKRKSKKAKKNSSRRRTKRITHAIAVGRVRGRVGGRDRRIVFTGTKREVHEQARLMRRAGAKSIHVGHVG